MLQNSENECYCLNSKMVRINIPYKQLDKMPDIGSYAGNISDYRDSDRPLYDIIREIADDFVPRDNREQLEFMTENPDMMTVALRRGYYKIDDTETYDVYEHARAAETMMIENDIIAHLSEGLLLSFANYIVFDMGIPKIRREWLPFIKQLAESGGIYARMTDLTARLGAYVNEHME